MDTIREFLEQIVSQGAYRIVLSAPDADAAFRKIKLNLDRSEYFAEKLTDKQAFHEHIPLEAACGRIEALFAGFSQINAWNDAYEFSARITKKGRLLTARRAAVSAPREEGREHKKSYLLEDCRVVPPLVDMGVMTPDGRVRAGMQDKFRQINRFLEFVDELVPAEGASTLNVIDFGCGKSYLSFIVYYYFTVIKGRKLRMTGIDLKQDVIARCTALAEKYDYDGLRFHAGDIADFAGSDNAPIDLILTLHACDTATDLALYHAIRFNAKYLLSVPCCQHELNQNADYTALPLFNDGGILRERVSALLTDSIRQKLLTACGYNARVMEFVDLSHTPKNLLIRAKRAVIPKAARRAALAEVEEMLQTLRTEQTLHRLLKEAGLLD